MIYAAVGGGTEIIMALDTITINLLKKEFEEKIIDARIEKAYQPEKDEILLVIKSHTDAYRLVISANASQPRIHFTKTVKENPQKAPMFCMLLRKHIQSGRIVGISQPECERILRFDIDSYDEFGELTRKYLICEMMGRNSNIILAKEDYTIIDSVKHVDFTVSSVRQILPGLKYEFPPAQDKIPVLSQELSSVKIDMSHEGVRPDKAIMAAVSGISPLLAREAVFRAIGEINKDCTQLDEGQKNNILSELKKIINFDMQPCIIIEKETGRTVDFSPIDILQYGESAEKKIYPDLNSLLDDFYKTRDNTERMKQKSADMVHILHTNIDRTAKKIEVLKKTIKDAKRKDEYKIYGDLLTANLYRFAQGDNSVEVENYYSENGETVRISLNPQLTPSQNAQRYYKLYRKAETAEREAAKQLESAGEELDYLESALVMTQNAQNESDLSAIRSELEQTGYVKKRNKGSRQKETVSKPRHYISSDGLDIYVGRNNMQNDRLTLKFANTHDLWFHTKKIHGSHVIIKLGQDKEVPPATIKEAAMLAAYYSKARDSANVPVDYTVVKNVKKPNGAKPGMVIYDGYNTIYVKPEITVEESKNFN